MHELAIVHEVLAQAERSAEGARIRRIVLEIGKLSAVMPDAVRFAFDLATPETLAEGASLEIVETPGRARCLVCSAEVLLERPFGRCACGNSELEWLAGEELRILEVEVV